MFNVHAYDSVKDILRSNSLDVGLYFHYFNNMVIILILLSIFILIIYVHKNYYNTNIYTSDRTLYQ